MLPGFVAALVLAADWYVDGDAGCPGDGSDGAPFCSVQDAFDNDALAAGDAILLRTAAVPYEGAFLGEGDAAPVSGTVDAPIVLRPDAGHSPVVAGAIRIHHSAHWHVRGLVFHGEGDASPLVAIEVFTDGVVGEVHGIVVEDNTILGFGGAPELDVGSYGSAGIISVGSWTADDTPMMIGPVVRNNRLRDSRGPGVSIGRALDAVVEGNEIAALGCQLENSYLQAEPDDYYARAAVIGIRVRRSAGARIVRNRIDDLDVASCDPFDVDSLGVYGIWADAALEVEVDHNLVRDVGMQAGYGMGIAITQSSHDARVHHNVVVRADRCGLCNGIESPGGADDIRFVNNTIVGGAEHGIDLMQGDGAFIGNNLVSGTLDAAIRILAVEGYVTNWSADHNLYWDDGSRDGVGQIGWTVETDLATWQSDCGCDAGSVVADPALPGGAAAEDFTVAAASPAIDAGAELAEVPDYNGAAPDVGALEAPLAVSAGIAADEPAIVRLLVEHAARGPLAVDAGCIGLAVEVDGAAVPLASCSADGNEVLVELAAPVWSGQAVALKHTGSTITDEARIGGVVSAFLRPFELAVDNAVQDDAPADTGTTTMDTGPGTETSGATGEGADTSTVDPSAAQDAGFPEAGACECSARSSGAAAWSWMLVVLAARARRRERTS